MGSLTVLINQFVDGVFRLYANSSKVPKMSRVAELHAAIDGDYLSEVSQLVDEGVDVNLIHRQETAFTRAIDVSHYRAAEIVIKSKLFNVNAKNQFERTPVYVTAKKGLTDFVMKLVTMGADVNIADVRGITPLGACSWNDSHEAAEVLLEHGANVNQADCQGDTPLFRACSNVCKGMVMVLLAHKCDVNQANSERKTPLMAALPSYYSTHVAGKKITTSLSICEMLIRAGCDLNCKDAFGKTALHQTVDNNDIYSLCLLAENGCELDVPGGNGNTPFVEAIMPLRPRYELARYLLYYGADPNQKLENLFDENQPITPLSLLLSGAVGPKDRMNKWSKALLLLTIWGAVYPTKTAVLMDEREYGEDDDLPFPEAVERDVRQWLTSSEPCSLQHQARLTTRDALGRQNIIPKIDTLPISSTLKQYLSLGMRSECKSFTQLCSLHVNIEDGSNDKVNELLASGTDINIVIHNKTPLALALEVGNTGAARAILEHEPKPRTKMINAFQESALHLVAKYGRKEVLDEVLSLSENINEKDFEGRTPLERAVRMGHFDIATILVDKGAEICCQRNQSIPFLHMAAAYGDEDFVNILLEKGMDPNSVDKFGSTPLHIAATKGADYLKRFVALPGLYHDSIAANLDAVHMMLTDGEPRYVRTNTGHAAVIECLIKHGADLKKLDGQNQTPLQRAQQTQSLPADLLRKLDGQPKV